MITKKDLMLRIFDLELQNIELEERIYILELANKPKKRRNQSRKERKEK